MQQRLRHLGPTSLMLALSVSLIAVGNAAPVPQFLKEGRAQEKAQEEPKPAPPEPSPSASDEDPPLAPVSVDPALVKAGSERYNLYCFKCHGLNMVNQGGGSFDLRTFPIHNKERFFNSVTNGKRTMPAWGAVLKKDDIEALWNYVVSYQVSKKDAQ